MLRATTEPSLSLPAAADLLLGELRRTTIFNAETVGAVREPPLQRCPFSSEGGTVRISSPAAAFVVLCLVAAGCTQPDAKQKPESASPPVPVHEEGVIRIRD